MSQQAETTCQIRNVEGEKTHEQRVVSVPSLSECIVPILPPLLQCPGLHSVVETPFRFGPYFPCVQLWISFGPSFRFLTVSSLAKADESFPEDGEALIC